ncbi:hypothetical protein [Lederbergia lenta]|uniref:hypothetical protein n=1 Tax=Lederbergia lenta TaxID=1467 RepID=UPI00204198E9|nr:hypothetical protein [Lederbergia lenta]MCM3109880.1 hypothetical protein [Lederbergia lenta]
MMSDLLINFCPRCGHRVTDSVINSLENGGDWTCVNCECYVEAYVLDQTDFELEAER